MVNPARTSHQRPPQRSTRSLEVLVDLPVLPHHRPSLKRRDVSTLRGEAQAVGSAERMLVKGSTRRIGELPSCTRPAELEKTSGRGAAMAISPGAGPASADAE